MNRPSEPNALVEDPRLTALVLRLAWPVIAGMGLQSLFVLTDLFWVGRLGASAVAAVSTSVFVSWALLSLGEMISVGVLSLSARHLGAGRRREASEIAWQGLFWGAVLAVALLVAGVVGAGPLFRAVSEDPEVRRQGAAYLAILFAGAPVLFLELILQDLFRGSGDTRTPFRVLTVALVLNALLDPVLIFGPGPAPRLGVAGAALASLVAHVVGLSLYLWIARGGERPIPLGPGRRGFRPRFTAARRLVGIGFPLTFIGIVFSAVYLFLGRTAAVFGTSTLAALGIVNRIESISYLTTHGMGVATATLVGQNLGAGRVDRVERLARRAAHLGTAAGFVFLAVYLLVPRPLVRLFTRDPEAVREGVEFLRIVALCQVFQAWELVLEGGFAGSGHTLPPMLISVPISLVRVPAAWLLSGPLGMGPSGIWWTISGTAAIRGLLSRFWWTRVARDLRPGGDSAASERAAAGLPSIPGEGGR